MIGQVYNVLMSPTAEQLRKESLDRLRRMTPAERVAEALLLGERAIVSYAASHGVPRNEAQRRLERSSQMGRRLSRVMLALIG